MIPRPISDCDETTVLAVSLRPSISMISPSIKLSFSKHSGSILAIDLPTSACENASATFNFNSSLLMIKPPDEFFIFQIKVIDILKNKYKQF
jgi:hypothetical protein